MTEHDVLVRALRKGHARVRFVPAPSGPIVRLDDRELFPADALGLGLALIEAAMQAGGKAA